MLPLCAPFWLTKEITILRQVLERLRVEGNTATVDSTIVLDICGASETHGSSNIAFTPSGDMLIAAGDGSQFDSIDGTQGTVMSLYLINSQRVT